VRRVAAVLFLLASNWLPASATSARVDPPALMHSIATSTNWAGYAATGAVFSYVRGSWTEPAVTCSSPRLQASSFWIGIDGYVSSSQTLEQVGTDADCNGPNQAVYYAWYEFVPAAAVPLPKHDVVRPGDRMSASVTVTGTRYSVAIKDMTQGWHFSTKQTVTDAQDGSAEWIAEAPSTCARFSCQTLPLADFGKVGFANAAATGPRHLKTITGFSHAGIDMVNGLGNVRASTSALAAKGSTFSVTWANV
jgi:hypothetical protein